MKKLITFTLFAILLLSTGYVLGIQSRESRDIARAEGARQGEIRGYEKGQEEGFRAGAEESQEKAYRESYARAYRKAYRDQFSRGKMNPPKKIEVKIP